MIVVLSYANEATNGNPLDNLKMGAGHQKEQSHGEKVRTLGQPNIQGEGGS